MRITPLLQRWGALIEDTDERDFIEYGDMLRSHLYARKLLVFRGLHGLKPQTLWFIGSLFGTPWNISAYKATGEKHFIHVLQSAESLAVVTRYASLEEDSAIGALPMPWHRDIPWHRDMRYPVRLLYPTKLNGPYEEATTDFCDCDLLLESPEPNVVEAITHTDLRIQNWYVANSSMDPELVPTRVVPLVERHPVTQAPSVMLNSFWDPELSDEVRRANPKFSRYTRRQGAWIVDAWSDSKRMGLGWIDDLHRRVLVDGNVYRHRWAPGDLVVMDNAGGVFHSRPPVPEGVTREFWRVNASHTGRHMVP